MSYQVLARKWRPKKFQEVIGQSHITRSLQNAIAKNKIGHAFMFVGTRGVGKTSLARIFAKAIRCEHFTDDLNACGKCVACLDFDTETSMNIIEIDGASNNSVDNIRDLISNVHYLPTSGKYKVYIVDEVHMLSTNAFNALLKTLEEPPAHVIFIFATTEAQKLLGTVLSRCQRFDFRNVSVEELSLHLKEISKVERITFENEQLIMQIAQMGRGSVRDALSLMDQVLTYSENNVIDEKTLTLSLGVAGPKSITAMWKAIVNGQVKELSKIYNSLLSENVPVKNIASSLLDEVFYKIGVKNELSDAEVIWIYETIAKETTWIFSSIVVEKAFEVCLSKVALRRSFFNKKVIGNNELEKAEKKESIESEMKATLTNDSSVAQKLEILMNEVTLEMKEAEELLVKNTPIIKNEKKDDVQIREAKVFTWEGFLNDLEKKSPASASNLEQGNILHPIQFNPDLLKIELGFGYSGQVFLDYLNEAEVYEKVINHLSHYFEIDSKKINLEMKQVSSEIDFVSQADIRENQAKLTNDDKIEEFKNNPLLKEAEKIFNAKVDKVILENKK